MQRAEPRILIQSRCFPTLFSAFGLSLAILLSACSVSTQLAVNSSGPGLTRGTAVSLEENATPQEMRGRFQSALASALASATSAITEEAPVFAEFSIAQTDASQGIISGKATTPKERDATDWLSAPRRKRNLDECEAQKLRASLVLYERSSGNIIYQGTAQATECAFSDEDLALIAQALVDDALTQR